MERASVAIRRRPRIFYGWWVVMEAAAINVYGAGVWFYGFPVFFRALLVEFPTWSRGVTAGAVSFSRLEGGLEAPIVGWLVDRYGPRKLAVVGAVIAGIGFMVMSRVSDFSLLGFMQFFLIPANIIGPIYAGLVFDLTGSYTVAFNSFIAALLLGTLFLLLTRKPTPRAAALQ